MMPYKIILKSESFISLLQADLVQPGKNLQGVAWIGFKGVSYIFLSIFYCETDVNTFSSCVENKIQDGKLKSTNLVFCCC